MTPSHERRLRPLDTSPHMSSTRVYDRLLSALKEGVFQPGERLGINDIAAQLSVSITPVREALERLQSHGLVDREPYRGFFVKQFSREEIQDIYHTRSALEGYAVRLATRNARPRDFDLLLAMQREGRDALDRGDVQGYAAYNERFHDTILQLSGNRVLYEMTANIKLRVSLLAARTIQITGRPARAIREHDEIVDMMRAGDALGAGRRMEEHILDAMREMLLRADG